MIINIQVDRRIEKSVIACAYVATLLNHLKAKEDVKQSLGVPFVAQQIKNLTSIHTDVGLVPGFAQWVNCGKVIHRCTRIWCDCGCGCGCGVGW